MLDDAERDRAERFHFGRDRLRFVLRRAYLRRILAGYLEIEPSAVRIHVSSLGRPRLDPRCDLEFSTSHSEGMAVVAVARGRQVGVDIERFRDVDDALGLASGLFSEPEIDLLRSTPLPARSRVFLGLWTRKEATAKALGIGLAIPLDGFAVLATGADGLGRPHDSRGVWPLVFRELDEPDGFIGAVAQGGSRIAVHHMNAATIDRW
jgi:4'-phosphopantetheinyl transferase